MPIFEYLCQECENRFETIVLGQQKARCPKCESKKLKQQLSTFAVGVESAGKRNTSATPCGSCGDPRGEGSCSIN